VLQRLLKRPAELEQLTFAIRQMSSGCLAPALFEEAVKGLRQSASEPVEGPRVPP
jgi:DNA-binding HxlR family transcriptional regulator